MNTKKAKPELHDEINEAAMSESISSETIHAYLSMLDKGRTWDFVERIQSRMKAVMGRRDGSVDAYARMLPKLAEGVAIRLSRERQPLLGGATMPQKVFARSDGLLPVFVWQSERMMAYVFGEGNQPEAAAPVSMCSRYQENERSLTGYDLRLSGVPPFASMTLCFLFESFHDAWSNLPSPEGNPGAVMLDSLVESFQEDVKLRLARDRVMVPISPENPAATNPRI